MIVDETQARRLVERFGSPLYVYDLDEIERRVTALRSALPADARLFYSMKANPLPAIARTVFETGHAVEISSWGELEAAQAAGVDVAGVLYTGPGKTVEEIDAALAAGLVWFSCESPEECRRVRDVARDRGDRARLLLRINPRESARGGLTMAGGESQFGMRPEAAVELASDRGVDGGAVEGIHLYLGTQLAGVDALLESFRISIEAADTVCAESGLAPAVIDIGGGFPWPYAGEGEGPDLAALRPGLESLCDARTASARAEVWFESGRSVAASSGTLLTTVLDVRPMEGSAVCVVLDAGINHLGGTGGLGRIIRQQLTITPLAPRSDGDAIETRIVGPLCTPLDCLVRRVTMPPVAAGDLLSVRNVGAYGLSASLVAFLGRRPPVEVVMRGGECVETYRMATGHVRGGITV